MTHSDRIRQYIAGRNGARFGANDIARVLADIPKASISVTLSDMCAREEIEHVGTKMGRGAGNLYIERALRPIRQAPVKKKTIPTKQQHIDENELIRTQCALRLHTVLDNITRAGVAHA